MSFAAASSSSSSSAAAASSSAAGVQPADVAAVAAFVAEATKPVDNGLKEVYDRLNGDLNKVFALIVDEERTVHDAEYARGHEDGVRGGNVNGYHLGYHQGAAHGAEIGYYAGVCAVYRRHRKPPCGTRLHDALVRCERALRDVPESNDPDVDIIAKVEKARSTFRLLASNLQINGLWPGAETDHF